MTKDNLTIEQQQQLKDLGNELHRIRVAKNISLETIAANTHISKRLLAAIEAGNMAELPEPFYIRALVAKFARQIGAEVSFELEVNNSLQGMSDRSDRTKRRSLNWNFQLRPFHLYFIYVLLVIACVKGITSFVERPVVVDRPSESPVVDSAPKPIQPAPVLVEQPETMPQFVSSNDSEAVSVGINLQERCWLKVMVDGQVAFEGVLPKGTQRQWTGQKVTIRAGNAGGVVISFNNQQQKILGAPGEVEEVTYTVN